MTKDATAIRPKETVLESQPVAFGALVRRIHAEYLEMPGLTLTMPQAARLWNMTAPQLERVLGELVEREFLMRDRRGAYRRRGCPRCA